MKGGFNLKRIKLLFHYLIFFIIGNIIFNTIYSIVKVAVINSIGGYENYIDNWFLSFKETFLVYAIIYLIFIVVSIIQKKTTINILNDKLKSIKE